MPLEVSNNDNFNPRDVDGLQRVFEWAMMGVNGRPEPEGEAPDPPMSTEDVVQQLSIAVAHLTYQVQELKEQLG